ncbi:uncharacterized protein LOC133185009 [Saccostrea echinata]|uniref:uncharacterized protein LOC133185009 n=1 Tax=Saccostrea echinata TaxID=191078 RepID=UPI002A831E63|nr:uncharacterized protein LOC133185009 [Saccostrea echinata]
MRNDQIKRKTKGIGKVKLREERKNYRNKRKGVGQQVLETEDGNQGSDVECYDDDEEAKEVSQQKDGDLQDHLASLALQNVSFPRGILCSGCSKIGVYDKDMNDVKRNTEQQRDRESDSREKCSICQTLGTKVNHQDNIRMSVLYSHEFYDKFSRDKRPGCLTDSGESTTRENSTLKIESTRQQTGDRKSDRLQREKSMDQTEPSKSSRRLSVNGVKGCMLEPTKLHPANPGVNAPSSVKDNGVPKVKQSSKESKTVDRSQISEECNNKTTKNDQIPQNVWSNGNTLPSLVNKISLVDSEKIEPMEKVLHTKEKLPEERSVKCESPVQTFKQPKKIPKTSDSRRSFILAATRRHAEGFSSLYMKRAMKGSTVRKDAWNKNGDIEHHHEERYTVESLGLTFGIPEFNLRLAGRTVKKTSGSPRRPSSHRSSASSNSQTFLPPIGETQRHSFSLKGFG